MFGQDNANQETSSLRDAAASEGRYRSNPSIKKRTLRRGSKKEKIRKQQNRSSVRAGDSYGSHGHEIKAKKNINVQSLTYMADESDVWRAHWAFEHFMLRGRFWNHRKFKTIKTYYWIVMTGIVQAVIAYTTNISSKAFIDVSGNETKIGICSGKDILVRRKLTRKHRVWVSFVQLHLNTGKKDEIRNDGSIFN